MRSRKYIQKQTAAKSIEKSKTRPSPSTHPELIPIPASRADADSVESLLPRQEVDFAELEDGTLVETIESPNDPANSLFAIYKDGAVRYAEMLECNNRVLVPIPRGDDIFKHVRLPRGGKPYNSVESLLAGILWVILNCVDINQEDAFLVSAFVLSTWFIERLPVAPYLALVGLPRSGKTTLLDVLNLLCRRALLTADITSAAFYEVYDKLTPTLLVDETRTAGNRGALFHLLRTGTTRGCVALRKGRSFRAFGPKVITWMELPNDAAVNSRSIIIPMHETSRINLARPTERKVLEAADDVQKELLQYRLENYKSLRLPKVEGDECLYSRTRDLYQALALPLGNHAEVLVRPLERQQEMNREPLSPASAAVLRALYRYIHSDPKSVKYANKELTIAVNLQLGGLPQFEVNAHAVGRALTFLGFTNRKRMNTGFILWLDLQTRKRIHKLAQDYGINRENEFCGKGFGRDCELCMNPAGSNPAFAETKGDSGIKPTWR